LLRTISCAGQSYDLRAALDTVKKWKLRSLLKVTKGHDSQFAPTIWPEAVKRDRYWSYWTTTCAANDRYR